MAGNIRYSPVGLVRTAANLSLPGARNVLHASWRPPKWRDSKRPSAPPSKKGVKSADDTPAPHVASPRTGDRRRAAGVLIGVGIYAKLSVS